MSLTSKLLAATVFSAAALCAGAQQTPGMPVTAPVQQYSFQTLPMAPEIDWTQSLTSLSMKVSLRILTTNLLKKHVHEWRPDGSADNSMPSRHAIWAYGVAGTLAYGTGPYTPWVTVVSHTLANGVGMQRVMARRHWPGDVFAGAALGIGLDCVVRGAVNLGFGNHHLYHGWRQVVNDHTTSLMSGTGAWFPSHNRSGRYRIGTGFSSWVRCSYGHGPVGVSGDVTVMSTPLKDMDIATDADHPSANVLHPLNSITVTAGPSLHLAIAGGPVALRAEARCGYRAWLRNSTVDTGAGSFTAAATAGFDVALTSRLQIGAEGGYDFSRLSLDGSSRSIGAFTAAILTRACF